MHCDHCNNLCSYETSAAIEHTADTWCLKCIEDNATACPKCGNYEETDRMISDGQCRDCLLEEYRKTNGPAWHDDRALELGEESND